jgi:CHASE2 domain-containing sensor protein
VNVHTARGRLGRVGVLAGALALGGLFFGALPSVLEIDESLGLGAMFTLRGPLRAPDSVVVVSITGEAAAAIGQDTELDEWPRESTASMPVAPPRWLST